MCHDREQNSLLGVRVRLLGVSLSVCQGVRVNILLQLFDAFCFVRMSRCEDVRL